MRCVGAIAPRVPEGADGAMRPQGPPGPQGAVGHQGAQGDIGLTGATGPQGPAGADGATGPMGPQGPAGFDGEMGPMGPEGQRGMDGMDGMDGWEGPMGPMGPDGMPGPEGPMGPQGPAGVQQVASFQGMAFSLPSEMPDFVFLGQTATVSFGEWSTVSGTAQAAIGASAANPLVATSGDFYYDLCWGWGGTAIPFSGSPSAMGPSTTPPSSRGMEMLSSTPTGAMANENANCRQ